MESTDLEEIKAALWEQASHPCTRVNWGTAQVMAARDNCWSCYAGFRAGILWKQ